MKSTQNFFPYSKLDENVTYIKYKKSFSGETIRLCLLRPQKLKYLAPQK